jgi:Cdc6-like AAA superfamily ATPase
MDGLHSQPTLPQSPPISTTRTGFKRAHSSAFQDRIAGERHTKTKHTRHPLYLQPPLTSWLSSKTGPPAAVLHQQHDTATVRQEPIDIIDLTTESPERNLKRVKIQPALSHVPHHHHHHHPIVSTQVPTLASSHIPKNDQHQSTPPPYSSEPKPSTTKTKAKKKKKKSTATDKDVSLPKPVQTTVEPELCAEQLQLIDLILSGRNIFYTGSAGCGKSTVLRAAVARLKEAHKKVRIVAPTGRAAVDIGGTTVHSFLGITPDHMKVSLEKLRARAHGKVITERFSETDVLVIDEISMVENHMLERLSEMMKAGRQYHNRMRGLPDDLPFGGVQCIFLGDFFQREFFPFFFFLLPGVLGE